MQTDSGHDIRLKFPTVEPKEIIGRQVPFCSVPIPAARQSQVKRCPMQSFKVQIHIDRNEALLNGLSHWGKTEFCFDPQELTQDERELLTKLNYKEKEDCYDLTPYSTGIKLERGLAALRICLQNFSANLAEKRKIKSEQFSKEIDWDLGRSYPRLNYDWHDADKDAAEKAKQKIADWLRESLARYTLATEASNDDKQFLDRLGREIVRVSKEIGVSLSLPEEIDEFICSQGGTLKDVVELYWLHPDSSSFARAFPYEDDTAHKVFDWLEACLENRNYFKGELLVLLESAKLRVAALLREKEAAEKKAEEDKKVALEEKRAKEKPLIIELLKQYGNSTAAERFEAGVLPPDELKEALRTCWFAPVEEFASFRKITKEEVVNESEEEYCSDEIEFQSWKNTTALKEPEYLLLKKISDKLSACNFPFAPKLTLTPTRHAGGYTESEVWAVERYSLHVDFCLDTDDYPTLKGIRLTSRLALD